MIRVVGTAGHVDHGKSALVKALSGIDPDRLKEEKEREMTIDLGFAWAELPSGTVMSLVDVPGHEDFVRNMLAGVGGIDAALFVVAADEGVMPQTREHLGILDLLEVGGGVVALTKRELVDGEWLELVREEVLELVEGTVLAGAPVVAVSARERQGLDELRAALEGVLDSVAVRSDLGRPRLPIDRVFTMAGFGTVVTGTLIDGRLALGDEVEVLPQGLTARVRGLQTHKRKVELAAPGSRVAINVAGVDRSQLKRGDVVALPGTLRPSRLVDARLRVLPGAPHELRHNQEIIFYQGSAEIPARLRLLGSDPTILPGAQAWVQLRLARPAVLVRGDRFIVRQPSPPLTVAGGTVVDPLPGRRHRRSPQTRDRLEGMASATPARLFPAVLSVGRPRSAAELVQRSGLSLEEAHRELEEAVARGELILLEGRLEPEAGSRALLAAREAWEGLSRRAVVMLREYHARHPLRSGMPREELASRLRLGPRVFGRWLETAEAEGRVADSGPVVALPDHRAELAAEQRTAVERLLRRFRDQPLSPPSVQEAMAEVGPEPYQLLLERGQLVQLTPQVVFDGETYRRLVADIVEGLKAGERITVAALRDRFETSRKYSLALLEHLDAERVTRRLGDERVLLREPEWLVTAS